MWRIQSLYGSWEKQGFVKVAVSRASPLTTVSVTRVSTVLSNLSSQGVTYDTGGADVKAGGHMAGMSRYT